MSYATTANVFARCPETVDSAQVATSDSGTLTTLCTALLATNYARVNSRLSSRYSVPIVLATSPLAYAVVKDIERDLTAADLIDHIRESVSDNWQVLWYARNLRQRAEDLLAELVSGATLLSDAVESTVEGGAIEDGETVDSLVAIPWFERGDNF